jgi:hypothetical protein
MTALPQFSETSWIVTISVLGGVAIAWAIVVWVVSVAKIVVQHRERMAQIGLAMNASKPPQAFPPGDSESSYPGSSPPQSSHPQPSHTGEWPRKSAAG